MSQGLDCGTAFICATRIDKDGKMRTKHIRDMFIEMNYNEDTKKILDTLKASYIIHNQKLYVIGDNCIGIANAMPVAIVRRPMERGVISPNDPDAAMILEALFKDILGKPKKNGEICYYSVPATPLNLKPNEFFSTDYHEDIIGQVLIGLGYEPKPINEALCVAYDSLQNHMLTGISISFGAGMVNICHSTLGMEANSFSIIGSGDKVDQEVSYNFKGHGITTTKVIRLKESGTVHVLNDMNPDFSKATNARETLDLRLKQAICMSYKRVVENLVKNIKTQLPIHNFDEPYPIVLAGGTTLINGFVELFNSVLKTEGVENIKEVIHNKDSAFYSVSHGAALRALAYERELDDTAKTV